MSKTVSVPLDDMPEWEIDCMNYYGKVLEGEYAHWCNEYDGLPIDETCIEFQNCLCFEWEGA